MDAGTITAVAGLLVGLGALGTAAEKLGRLALDWRRRTKAEEQPPDEQPPDDTPKLAA